MPLADCRVRVTHIACAVHVGTHYDAPLHFFNGGRSIEQYEPERYAAVARLSHGAGEAVAPANLRAVLPAGDFVFLSFGFAQLARSPAYYDWLYLTPEAARYLVGLGIGAVGTDTLSPDAPGGAPSPVHRELLGNDVLIVENLGTGLEVGAGACRLSRRRCRSRARTA